MKTQIDLKSALLGMGIGVLVMFATGAGTSSNEIGRYKIAAGNSTDSGGYAMIVDTQTGKTWGILIPKDFVNNKAGEFWNEKK